MSSVLISGTTCLSTPLSESALQFNLLSLKSISLTINTIKYLLIINS